MFLQQPGLILGQVAGYKRSSFTRVSHYTVLLGVCWPLIVQLNPKTNCFLQKVIVISALMATEKLSIQLQFVRKTNLSIKCLETPNMDDWQLCWLWHEILETRMGLDQWDTVQTTSSLGMGLLSHIPYWSSVPSFFPPQSHTVLELVSHCSHSWQPVSALLLHVSTPVNKEILYTCTRDWY